MKPRILYNFLTDDELLRISNKIKATERITAGEIAVSIREYKSFLERRTTLRKLAEKEFRRLGINKTREGTGVIIYILLSKRQFYILADDNINKITGEKVWEEIKDTMQQKFVSGEFCKGILFGIDEIGKILSQHFSVRPDDTNEISNRVVVQR